MGIGKQAGYAALQGAAIGVGFDIAQKLWNGEEIKGKEVVETALITGADFGVKAAAAGALKVGVEKNIIKVIPKGTPVSTISNIAFIAIEDAKALGKMVNGKSFYRRNAKTKPQLETCMHCGKPIEQTKHKRQKKFCSDKCRNSWWSANPQNRRPKKLYSHICAYCGTAFQSDRTKSKYCSVKCFADARRKENII